MAFVFLASQCRRRLPAAPPSRGRPCLGRVVLFMYLATHEGEPPTGDFHPHTHAHAGRTPTIAPYCRPLAVPAEPERSRCGRQTVTGRVRCLSLQVKPKGAIQRL